ncbi:hypothetical protein QFC20_003647 [Naganishia adeliensis]|uniref:Uncharacterized protein n=1 Tax=Naganishia adeliensis TaxID=92952 RepID=A0ACC2W8I9_9TREE|nr:hypothetical protein QFC20_003647 [Naganishia adeliensis]
MLTVYIVRHGQTDHNMRGIVQGHLNTSLNATGRAQGESLAKRLQEEGVHFDFAFTSDLDRASETALAIVQKQGNGLALQLEAGLRERDLGDLEGTKGPIRRPYPANMETSEALGKRCLAWWNGTIVPLAREPGDKTAFVTSHSGYLQILFERLVAEERHGGLGYAVKGQALRQYPFHSFKNTCVTVIKVDEKGNGVVERYNDHAHLKEGTSKVESADVVA